MPELARILNVAADQDSQVSLEGLQFGQDLFAALRLSLHPPHVAERQNQGNASVEKLPTPGIPFCVYQDHLEGGSKVRASTVTSLIIATFLTHNLKS